MKRVLGQIAGILTIACMATTVVSAQNSTDRQRTRQIRPRSINAQAGQLDDKTHGTNIRASQLIGMNIQNSRGETVGEIEDIVLDADSGRIRYAAVSYGGFLGVGDKLFAVPFSALKCQADRDDPAERVMILNVTQEQLKGATGFDEDHWPNFADRNFTNQIDKQYGVERRFDERTNRDALRGGVDVDVDRDGVKVDVNRDEK